MTQIKSLLLGAILLSGIVSPAIGDDSKALLSTPTAVLFSDTFERESLGDTWQASQRSFAIRDGVMTGGMRDQATHPAIAKVSTNFRDIALRFSFRFDGAKSFNIVFNDINEKSVHSGHVARMTVSPNKLTLTDDKTGLMSLEWVHKRNDPQFKNAVDQVREEKSHAFPFNWQTGQWYTLLMEVVGDEVLVSIDGKPAGYIRCAGFGHPTKTSFHFSISGRDLCVDNLTAWKAEPNPEWNRRRDAVIERLKE
jgi:hypothetical protein